MTERAQRFLGLAILPFLLGLVFFAASLTPSLIPRSWLVQGVLAGLVTAIGYMIGRLLVSLWRALDLPSLTGRTGRIVHLLAAVPVLALLAWNLSRVGEWQNGIRERMGMEPIDTVHTLRMLALAALVFATCFLIGLVVQALFDWLRRRLYRIMPERSANVAGFVLAALGIFILTRDGLLDTLLAAADESYETAQELFESAPPPPLDPRVPGSPASLVDWGAMGQPGRNFVTGGPDAAAISAFTGRPARDPVRVYVGRAQAEAPEERARIALMEMQRLGAFDRKILIVASPTGTGWLDPGSHDVVEYMHDGDVATVAVQYSYLQSPLALIFETDTGLDQATATIRTVHEHWRELPPEDRPRFYIHGLSLGAWSSMYGVDPFRLINDPIDGALWVGPPFPSRLWNEATAARIPNSPFVRPVVGEGELVRFVSHSGGLDRDYADWRGLRVVFLQYASDPIVFYEPASAWRRPVWMREPPAPDVSPDLSFMPVVTQFQLALDMALATTAPAGHGHSYYARDYIAPWAAVTDPEGWTDTDSASLAAHCDNGFQGGCDN